MDDRARPSTDRDAGLRRLRSLTLTTAMIGAATAVGFGVVAAISNPGHQAAQVVAADGLTSTYRQSGSQADATPAPVDAGAFQAPGFQVPQQLPFSVPGAGGHATSGGS